MKQYLFLIFSKTDMRALHQFQTTSLYEGYKNFQTFVQNRVKQDSAYMPVSFSDFKLVLIGELDVDFFTNSTKPLIAYDPFVVVDRDYVMNSLEKLKASNSGTFNSLGAVVYNYEEELKKIKEESKK